MTIVVTADGTIRCLYGEAIDLGTFGLPRITRASHVEPTSDGRWLADLSPVGGPQLGPFGNRSEALAAEIVCLEERWLMANGG